MSDFRQKERPAPSPQKPASSSNPNPVKTQPAQMQPAQTEKTAPSQPAQSAKPNDSKPDKKKAAMSKSEALNAKYANLSPEERALRIQAEKFADAKKKLENAKAKKERALGVALLETVSDDLTVDEWNKMIGAHPNITVQLQRLFSAEMGRDPKPRAKRKPRKKTNG